MNKIVSIHSFRQSVGKSSLAANLACLLTLQGQRVGLVDTDFQGASAHLFFGLKDGEIKPTFNDYLWKKCSIKKAAFDITDKLGTQSNGKLYLLAASTKVSDIMTMLRSSMNIDRFTQGLDKLEKAFGLDILLVDTRAGLNENNLMTIALSNTLILVLHPDSQDFQGTAVTVDVARRLMVPSIQLVLNDSSPALNPDEVSRELEQTYHCDGSFILTHTEELLALGSRQPFVIAYPDHPLTTSIKQIAEKL